MGPGWDGRVFMANLLIVVYCGCYVCLMGREWMCRE